ncbi:MAG: VOC family protein [Verrucomicrobiales bacterium]|nr:VOC family protein [Verrucomicrobiales bacterium]
MSNQRNPVGWFEIYVADMDRARKFYETVLGIQFEALPAPNNELGELEMLMFPGEPAGPGCCGALAKMEGVTPGGGGTLVYFFCADCADEESRVADAGGNVVKSKFSIGEYGDIALVIDSEGNMIGLHNPPAGGEGC